MLQELSFPGGFIKFWPLCTRWNRSDLFSFPFPRAPQHCLSMWHPLQPSCSSKQRRRDCWLIFFSRWRLLLNSWKSDCVLLVYSPLTKQNLKQNSQKKNCATCEGHYPRTVIPANHTWVAQLKSTCLSACFYPLANSYLLWEHLPLSQRLKAALTSPTSVFLPVSSS